MTDEYYWEKNFHDVADQTCPECGEGLKHQVMGTDKPPAVVCECDYMFWLAYPCEACNQVVKDWWN